MDRGGGTARRLASLPTSRHPKKPGKPARFVGADGRELFSRTQAAKALGVSEDAVRRLERRGLLRAVVLEGVHVFTRHELERHRDAKPSSNASAAFALFEQGLAAVDVVIKLNLDPSEIQSLYAAWSTMSGAIVVAAPRGSAKAWERAYGVGPLTPAKIRLALELVGAVPELRARLQTAG